MPSPDCPWKKCETCSSYNPLQSPITYVQANTTIVGECRYAAPSFGAWGQAVWPGVLTVEDWCDRWLPSKKNCETRVWISREAQAQNLGSHVSRVKDKHPE